jgi:hypothetical protein
MSTDHAVLTTIIQSPTYSTILQEYYRSKGWVEPYNYVVLELKACPYKLKLSQTDNEAIINFASLFNQ